MLADLKAENIMLTNPQRRGTAADSAAALDDIACERLVLTDFGLARRITGDKEFKVGASL